MTKFKSQALQYIRIKYWKASGSGNPSSLIPALWNIGILLHKQATLGKHFRPECTSAFLLLLSLTYPIDSAGGKVAKSFTVSLPCHIRKRILEKIRR